MRETLEQIEAEVWPEPSPDATHLVQRCHKLRKVPLEDLTPGDMRVLIGQGIGTTHLVPQALRVLQSEPLVEGDYFPGDLLTVLMRLPAEYWSTNREELHQLCSAAQAALGKLSEEELLSSAAELQNDIRAFLAKPDA